MADSPLDADMLPSPWRSRLLVIGVLGVWIILALRLIDLQIMNRLGLADKAERQRTLIETIPARPGDIVDRHGRLLATTIRAKSLFVNPEAIENPWEFARSIAEAAGIDSDRLFVRISESRDKQFLWVKRRISDEAAERVKALDLPKGSYGFREEYLRQYPQGQLAVHLLGLRDIDNHGQGGIEQSFDSVLRGSDGSRVLIRDARGRVIEVQESVQEAPRHGRTVVLTLDAVIQLYAERELDRIMEDWQPLHAGAIVLDPHSGEVLAMASRPSFDPNDLGDVPPDAWKNFNIASVYEPGSTLKPFIVAWALKEGLIARDEVLDCENGAYRMGRRLLHDHHPYGALSISDVLVKSSNIGMAKIGERLTITRLFDALKSFGFGQRTGIELPGEVAGLVRPLADWDEYSTGSVPMGQELAVTPLQLISAHAALANGGQLMRPHLVLRHTDAILPEGPSAPPVRSGSSTVCTVIDADIANWLVQGPMVNVVKQGTGKQARLEDYTVFGKTGTAQKLDPDTRAYAKDRDVCSFLCGAPAANPQLLVLIVVDEPKGDDLGGGTVAAPHAAELLRQSLIHLRVGSDLARRR
jgi:cell division protein FtsI/penicillin-binding protein 2